MEPSSGGFIPGGNTSYNHNHKRPPDPTNSSSDPTKRRHNHQTPMPLTPSATTIQLPSPSDVVFRLLCPASKTASLIGKAGSFIRQLRDLTGVKVQIDDLNASSEERIILILANNSGNSFGHSEEGSPAQQALLKLFERLVRKVDDDRADPKDRDYNDTGSNGGGAGASEAKSIVLGRLLAHSHQVRSLPVENIKLESGAQITVLPKDQIPAFASPGDELIQLTGNVSAVKRALLFVTSHFQDSSRVNTANSSTSKPLAVRLGTGTPAQIDNFPHRGYASGSHAADCHFVPGPEVMEAGPRMFVEEEIVFKVLCQFDKIGSLIGKGGSMVRALQNETGASIKVVDATPDSEERVVVISSRENSDQKLSPAQEAVMCVQSRIAEIGFESGATVIARLLVPSQQIGFLLGKGGSIINEMRRSTGASIRIFPKEHTPKCGFQNHEVVQVTGGSHSVQDALFQITCRLRETMFPMRLPPPNYGGPSRLPPFPEMPPPPFAPPHHPVSPCPYSSQAGPPHGIDHSCVPPQPLDNQRAFSHGHNRGPSNMEAIPYPYAYDKTNSPRSWTPQAVGKGNCGGDAFGTASRIVGYGSGGNLTSNYTSKTVEYNIPIIYLNHIYGENNRNLIQIQQASGAKVLIHEPKPGAIQCTVVVSGAPDQAHIAQCLIHAFILRGVTTA